ncbi:hypothetical protein [Streptomyces sp. NPDC001435]|uniref:hypothetical protein n=1 Tax=unclassified Streptomyces TaxID=2593676 RepID=UPI0036B543DB
MQLSDPQAAEAVRCRIDGMTLTNTAPAPPATQSEPGGPGALRRGLPVLASAAVLLVLLLLPFSALNIPVLLDGPVNSPGSLQLFALCLLFAGLALSYDLMFGRTGRSPSGTPSTWQAAHTVHSWP